MRIRAIALAVLVAGCSGAAPTPQIIYVTPAPTATPLATPSPTVTPTASPAPTPSPTAHPTPTANATGVWEVSEVTNDPVSGKPTATAIVRSSGSKSALGKTIALVVRCKDDETDLFILWGDFLNTDRTITVTTRVDADASQTTSWGNSTDQTTTFFIGDVQAYVKTLFGHTSFVARTTPYNESPLTGLFDITGIQVATAKVQASCNWT